MKALRVRCSACSEVQGLIDNSVAVFPVRRQQRRLGRIAPNPPDGMAFGLAAGRRANSQASPALPSHRPFLPMICADPGDPLFGHQVSMLSIRRLQMAIFRMTTPLPTTETGRGIHSHRHHPPIVWRTVPASALVCLRSPAHTACLTARHFDDFSKIRFASTDCCPRAPKAARSTLTERDPWSVEIYKPNWSAFAISPINERGRNIRDRNGRARHGVVAFTI
ncbi:hypothetical protein GGE23_005337 [Rhizobium leguminosarum]|nr:hypothetical protein [Rhizobium leguminosarum]MBB4435108.1 hypothetical protein [Rhizobium esperanzae]MBB4310992.1 hypothetical protein [Rhizobium leguminosarum]MBB4419896.1 hypothetical protein [Rhizobium leguminosarum]MBB4531960.1 hypothetical protein [Rhizobium leguminosarum]